MEKCYTCLVWELASGLPCSLDLTDPGFHYSVLSEFRARLLAGQAEQRLLTVLLEQFEQYGWLKARGRQRTDSTHVLAAVRVFNRWNSWGRPCDIHSTCSPR
jgi:transposase